MERSQAIFVKPALLITIVCFCLSCGKDEVIFRITNQTPFGIDSLRVLPDRNIGNNYISLKPNETKDFFTEMGNGGTDGAYQISYKIGDTIIKNHFGYYSNGIPMEKLTKIFIKPDTVYFEFIR